MSSTQKFSQEKLSSALQIVIPSPDYADIQKTKPSDVDVPCKHQFHQHLNSCVDDALSLLQTYQMEFDVDSKLGRLPNCFVREFGKTISDYVMLRDPNHNEFEVHVLKKSTELYFDDGWCSLKDAYSICFGAWVTLTHVSPKLLTIRLLTRWGSEVNYPSYDPPLRHLLPKSGSCGGIGPSTTTTISPNSSRPNSFVRSYVKELTLYDIHSGTLVLPWYGFGQSAFAFVFSDLVLVDNADAHYKCDLNFGVDSHGELCCKLSGGWLDLCTAHGVVEGDRVKFSVAHYSASNFLYVCIYRRIRLNSTSKHMEMEA